MKSKESKDQKDLKSKKTHNNTDTNDISIGGQLSSHTSQAISALGQ